MLGKKIDVLVSNENLMFLPLNVEEIFDQSLVENNGANKNLIKSKNTLVKSFENKSKLSKIGLYSCVLLGITLVLIVFVR